MGGGINTPPAHRRMRLGLGRRRLFVVLVGDRSRHRDAAGERGERGVIIRLPLMPGGLERRGGGINTPPAHLSTHASQSRSETASSRQCGTARLAARGEIDPGTVMQGGRRGVNEGYHQLLKPP